MSVFDGIAGGYDWAMWPLEIAALRRLRARLAAQARGNVLEIGVGTGANLPHYNGGARVFALDASVEMLRAAARRARLAAAQADGQRLPYANNTFDTVVATLVLCSVPDPPQALEEIGRVLKPGGRLLLLEHTRGTHPVTRWFTDTFHPLWHRLNGSCHLNRETARAVAQAGFAVEVERHFGGVVQLICASKT